MVGVLEVTQSEKECDTDSEVQQRYMVKLKEKKEE